MEERKQRTIRCMKCGREETEKIFGSGFPGWLQLCELTYIDELTKKEKSPEVCPQCKMLLINFLENK
jgi:ribosomal protein L37AE/L43A